MRIGGKAIMRGSRQKVGSSSRLRFRLISAKWSTICQAAAARDLAPDQYLQTLQAANLCFASPASDSADPAKATKAAPGAAAAPKSKNENQFLKI